MKGEIIAIGDELTSGRITNTTSGFAASRLFAAGLGVHAIHTIGDGLEQIGAAVREAVQRADFLLVTGGLGGTSDDVTNEAIIAALDLPASPHADIIAALAERIPTPSPAQEKAIIRLATLPQGAKILDTTYRMAGYELIYQGKLIFFLPGIPSQMHYLLETQVLVRLQEYMAEQDHRVSTMRQHIYKVFGLFEVEINKRLADLEDMYDIHLGYYPVGTDVHVSVTIREDQEDRQPEIDQAIQERLGECIYAHEIAGDAKQTRCSDGTVCIPANLAEAVGQAMAMKRHRLCVAESCTGGRIASKLTTIPGSSQWFVGGVAAYSNQVKKEFLRVDQALLDNYGAVSPQTARAMAARLADQLRCDTSISVTGVAGPGGGSAEKPVGTVYMGLFYNKTLHTFLFHFKGDREDIQERSTQTALDLLRRAALGLPLPEGAMVK